MTSSLWDSCLNLLEDKLDAQQFNTWIRPLHAVVADNSIKLLAPNNIVKTRVNDEFMSSISESVKRFSPGEDFLVSIEVGTAHTLTKNKPRTNATRTNFSRKNDHRNQQVENNIRKDFTFESFVQGKSNQLARAASIQVGENPGCVTYNPLFIYGGVGLGKTHLMHAIGNLIIERKPDARVIYVHSERFVGDMVKAFQHNTIDNFKRHYRSVDVLLIDDIQFFANKERSQEEFFHTFNTLLEGQRQIIMTCDRYPKEVGGLEERLKSRFGHGLPVAIEPPDLETRTAILINKAEQRDIILPDDVAFFIAKRIHSNVRDLEGALNRLQAHARFTNQAITIDLTRDALRDLISSQDKQLTIENIQKTVTEYYKIKYSEMLSKRRTRSIAYPRQIAMALCRELTNHSFPEIGEAFGGRDHTTVLHACRKIAAQRKTDQNAEEDVANLLRILTT